MEQNLISKIIRSRRRTLGLEITFDARLVIRAPLHASIGFINQIVEKRRAWIIEKQQDAKRRYRPALQPRFVEGEEFLYLGNSYKLRIVYSATQPLEFNGIEFVLDQRFLAKAKHLFQEWYFNQAKDVFVGRVDFYSQMAGQKYSRITISNARTRWGSCGSGKTLNFNWRLMMAPLDKIDYVVAHEVAHLEELNHSYKFWNKLKTLMPDYEVRQQWFRNNSYLLSF